ncbi:DMT family transporter [Streptomyces sp. PTM05]|uniref:DMT family transporter n=1 Tax=Streptantibioticus parmotrematis TaxID=2873249 RepID=A0ABS7QJQ6_9ACTN|nr:DMT family transporter [Streptantibioticus parmotrematis]MBY8883407.1 DMT family transporter [Streptantibioticus parmotrematis]
MAVAVVCALLAAVSNALATVLQRRAASTVPLSKGFSGSLITSLARRPVWLGGMAAVMAAACFQALALYNGALSVVQPIFVLELPTALLIAGLIFHRSLPRQGWAGVACIVVGVGTALGAASPTAGSSQTGMVRWIPVLVLCGAVTVLLIGAALRRPAGKARAAAFALGAAIGYALTAALMKSAAYTWDTRGPVGFFTAWQTYGFALAGVAALFLLENALQSGPIAASQPVLTMGDAVLSISLGVVLYGERIRTGWWLVPELAGAAVTLAGALLLTTTPMAKSLLAPLPDQT